MLKPYFLIPVFTVLLVLAILSIHQNADISMDFRISAVVGFNYTRDVPSINRSHPPILQPSQIQPVQILLWTPWFDLIYPYETVINVPTSSIPCSITSDRSQLNSSRAIVYHIRNLDWNDLPPARLPDQYYVFMLWESPYHSERDFPRPWTQWFFNLSLTYRRDSDVYAPYGKFQPRTTPLKVYLKQLIERKTDPIVWMVSNCQTPSKRFEYVQELRMYIPIDVYGGCGDQTCPKHANASRDPSDCESIFERKYKFYLAFENSLCPDYVTEKLYQHMQQYVVPVVLERKNYEHLCPNYSRPWFVAADDFKSPWQLANYLLYLNLNDTAYYEYLSWHEHYESFVNVQSDVSLLTDDHWADLCRKVHTLKGRRVVRNVPRWWENSGCHEPKWVF